MPRTAARRCARRPAPSAREKLAGAQSLQLSGGHAARRAGPSHHLRSAGMPAGTPHLQPRRPAAAQECGREDPRPARQLGHHMNLTSRTIRPSHDDASHVILLPTAHRAGRHAGRPVHVPRHCGYRAASSARRDECGFTSGHTRPDNWLVAARSTSASAAGQMLRAWTPWWKASNHLAPSQLVACPRRNQPAVAPAAPRAHWPLVTLL